VFFFEIENEMEHLLPWRPLLELSRMTDQTVDKYSFVRVDNNFYSVPEYLIPYLLFSPYLLLGVIILMILCVLLICFYHRENIKIALLLAGIPVALTGLIFLTAAVIVGSYPGLLGDTMYRLAGFAGGIVYLTIRYSIIFTAIGMISVLAYFVLKSIEHRRPQ